MCSKQTGRIDTSVHIFHHDQAMMLPSVYWQCTQILLHSGSGDRHRYPSPIGNVSLGH